jgi:hypothetical protein
MTTLSRFLCALLLLTGLVGAASAAEEIRSFDVRIDVGENGTLSVTEEIVVNAEGNQISRGIFRDIPLRYEDASGRMREVRLEVQSVTRDGRAEPYTVERGSGVLRIRIGDGDVMLRHGEHAYEISYETTRQVRFFDDHDELYWNVTGNGWDFPIRRATAEINLPDGARATDVTYFTGSYGSTERAAQARRLKGGETIVVEATGRLGAREGLTAVVAFPKGFVSPPTADDEYADWLQDNLGSIGLLLMVAYYFWAWNRVGRDPPASVVVPRWHAPDNVSPALANYIEQRGFKGQGWDAFGASIIDLAVKGHLEIDNPSKAMTLIRKGSGVPAGLGVGQKAILSALPGDGDSLTVDKANGETVQAIGNAFRSAMEREHRNHYYRRNGGYVLVGIALSVLLLVLLLAFGQLEEETILAAVGILIPAAIVSVVSVNLGRKFRSAGSLLARIMAVLGAAFTGFVSLSILGAFAAVLTEIDFEPRVLSVVAGLVITNLVFFFLMGAPTPLGQKLSAEVAGLKQYLTLAEKDRMNMQGAPQMSPQHFETLLPYAVALGVEKPWSRAFDTWLAAATAAGAAAYAGPAWYHGSNFSPDRMGTDLGNIAGSLSDSFTASLPAPKSSSSGFSGGGFSGGGGGGGGGGGW